MTEREALSDSRCDEILAETHHVSISTVLMRPASQLNRQRALIRAGYRAGRAHGGVSGAAIEWAAVERAADLVCNWDWSDNDADAVASIERLREALMALAARRKTLASALYDAAPAPLAGEDK